MPRGVLTTRADAIVAVRAVDLAPGRMPPVCVKTGRIATDWQRVRFQSTPRWIYILILFSVVPFIIAWFMTRQVAVGAVPVAADISDRARRLRRQTLVVWGAAIVLLFLSTVLPVDALRTGAVALAFVCLLAVVGLQLAVAPGVSVGGDVRRGGDGTVVVLRRVHPGFVAAVRRRQSLEDATPSFGR